jgi:hypothetical protein
MLAEKADIKNRPWNAIFAVETRLLTANSAHWIEVR